MGLKNHLLFLDQGVELMALMDFREHDELKWLGVRPAHHGEQVLTQIETATIGHVIIYTVPAGKTLFLTYIFIGNATDDTAQYGISIFDSAPAFTNFLVMARVRTPYFGISLPCNFWPPIELEEGFSVRTYCHIARNRISTIHGWIE